MKFDLVVMQYTGQITDRKAHRCKQVRSTEVGQRLVTGFRLMLTEHLPQLLDGIVKISLPILNDGRGLLEWRQPELFSASATFLIAGKLKFTWFYFAGHNPETDSIAINATEKCIKELVSEVVVEP